uniref:Transposase Tc1-like domain-containing protein n=1 Tax=Amphiprion ocellaris TaxID=80972 RepID=A0AAQ5XE21_AMPOC
MVRPTKTAAADGRNIVRVVKKDPKTVFSDISNNLQRAAVKVSQSTVHRRLHEQKNRGYTRRCKPLISKKNMKARLEFAMKYRDEAQKFWDRVLWTDETKRNLYQSNGKAKVWRKKGSAHDPKHTSSSVKHSGGNIIAWACTASSGMGSLIYIADVTHGGSSKMNSEVSETFCLPI